MFSKLTPIRPSLLLLVVMVVLICLTQLVHSKKSDNAERRRLFSPSKIANIWAKRSQHANDDALARALDEFVSGDASEDAGALEPLFKTYKPQRREASSSSSRFRFKKSNKNNNDNEAAAAAAANAEGDDDDEDDEGQQGDQEEDNNMRSNFGQFMNDYQGDQNDQSWMQPPPQDGSASSLGQYSAISDLARGSDQQDSFHMRSSPFGSDPSMGYPKRLTSWNGYRTDIDPSDSQLVSPSNRINFAQPPSYHRRSRRNAPKYASPNFYYPPPPSPPHHQQQQQHYPGPQYQEEYDDCQYHTLINGDSEVILRKLLPFRMKGRTILRKCIRPPPHPNDPRYRVLLKGNQKSSFGGLRVSVKM